MKVSLNWIKDYVDLPADMDLKRLAYDLTMSTVDSDSFPTEDGQSNFGTGYAYRYGSENGTLEVQIDGEWWIFAANQ